MRKEFYKYLTELFKSDPKIVILLGDIGVHSLKECFNYDSSRIYNFGIMEQTIIGAASGLAKQGFIPFIHSIAPFITERCYEQLKIDLGHENVNCFVVSVGASYDYAALGSTHHCFNDLRIVSSIPNFKTYCPGNFKDVFWTIRTNIKNSSPKYIRLGEESNNYLGYNNTLINLNTNGICIVVGNSVKDIYNLKELCNCSLYYTYDISEFDVNKLKMTMKNFGIKNRFTIIEPCYDSGLVNKIATNFKDIEFIEHISLPKIFINQYGTKLENDFDLEMTDKQIINKIEGIYF